MTAKPNPTASSKRPLARGKPSSKLRRSSRPLRSLGLRTILVPVDFSERSRKAAEYAAGFARDYEASLIILHAVDPLLAAGRLESRELRRLKAASRKEAEQQLQEFGRKLAASEVRMRLTLRSGPAVEEIVSFADELKANLIVMASQGRSGLSRLLVGSVTERVVRAAPCPVLVVR